MIVRNATPADIQFIVENLRDHSRREIFLTRLPQFGARDLVNELLRLEAYAVVQKVFAPAGGAAPVFFFAAYVSGPASWSFRTLGTPDWLTVAPMVPRWISRTLEPLALRNGIHFCEFNVLADPRPDYRWFALMGCYPWGNPLPRGRNGELYQQMIWLRSRPVRPNHAAAVDAAAAALSSAPDRHGD